MAKIESLTAAQEQRLVEFREEWLAHGRSCEPADRATAERAFADFYTRLGKPKPVVFWVDGPASGLLLASICQRIAAGDSISETLRDNLGANLRANLRDNLWDNLWANLRDNLWDNLRDNLRDNPWANLRDNLRDNLRANLGDNLRDNLRDNLWANLRDNLWDNLWANLRDNLWDNLRDNLRDNPWANLRDNLRDNLRANLGDNLRDNLWANLWANLRDNLWANLWANLRDNLGTCFWGQHEAHWPAHFKFAAEIGVVYANDHAAILAGWADIARSCCWWWPRGGVVIASERPLSLSLDDRGRMHCETGPAMSFRDGWQVWAVGGVRVDEQIVMRPESQAVEHISGEQNEEVKRVRIDRYGWDAYLKKIDAELLDRRKNLIEGTRESLYRAGDMVVLVCVCPSTAKLFCLETPTTIKTCEQAQHYLSSGLSSRVISAA